MSESIKEQTRNGLIWRFVEQFSNYGIQFIIGIAMARALSPSDYGITALPEVFYALAGVFVGGGFGDALVRKKDLTDDDLSTAFYYSIAVGSLFYAVFFFSSPLIASFFNTPVLVPLVRITALGFIYGAIGTPQRTILHRNLDFKYIAKVNVVCVIVTGVIGITLAYSGYGVWALVISGLVSGILCQMLLLLKVKWLPQKRWSTESFKYLWGYGNKMMISSLLDTGYRNLTPMIVGKFFSPAQLGLYNRAKGYAAMPSQNIHAIVREVSFPVLSKIQDDTTRLMSFYRRMIRLSAFCVFPIMFLLSSLAHPLIVVLITEKWSGCVILLQLMCFSMMWYPIHALNLNILLVKGRTDLFLKLEVAKKILGLTVMICALPFGLVPFCAVGIVSSLISLFINTWYTGKFYQFGFKEQIRDLLPTVILCCAMYFIVFCLNTFIQNMVLQIIVGGISGVLFYFVSAVLLKRPELQDVKYMLNRKK